MLNAKYKTYKPRRILNVYKHCDGGWFWNRYREHNQCYLSDIKRFEKGVSLLVEKLREGIEELKGQCRVCSGRLNEEEEKDIDDLLNFLAPCWKPAIF